MTKNLDSRRFSGCLESISFFSSFFLFSLFWGGKLFAGAIPQLFTLYIIWLMCTFILKSYNQKEEIRNPHFFILCKGNNSGKPLLSPCPNCFSIQFQSETDKEQIYWLSYSLWQSKAFYPYLRGSVIPFVVLRDVKECLINGLKKMEENPGQFQKVMEALRNLEELEKKFKKNLEVIKIAKISFFKFI